LLDNAANGEQKSIYSAPFYLFPNGYKMCLRLYINGDLKARNTYMSLFFVIMRGENDANLQWPFKFKVTFTLIDQSTTNDNQHHISQFCWPNITSTTAICFERPKANMNVACGIPMFCPLGLFKENQNRYVRHDTMYIKIEIDLVTDGTSKICILTDELVCFFFVLALSLMDGAGELPNDEEHVDEVDDDISVMICGSDTA
jgi:TNF receptor-associated factor 2